MWAEFHVAIGLIAAGSTDLGVTSDGHHHRRIVLATLRNEGGCDNPDQLGMSSICTPNPGSQDFNGDGDLNDRVIAYRTLDVDADLDDVTVNPLVTTGLQIRRQFIGGHRRNETTDRMSGLFG